MNHHVRCLVSSSGEGLCGGRQQSGSKRLVTAWGKGGGGLYIRTNVFLHDSMSALLFVRRHEREQVVTVEGAILPREADLLHAANRDGGWNTRHV